MIASPSSRMTLTPSYLMGEPSAAVPSVVHSSAGAVGCGEDVFESGLYLADSVAVFSAPELARSVAPAELFGETMLPISLSSANSAAMVSMSALASSLPSASTNLFASCKSDIF